MGANLCSCQQRSSQSAVLATANLFLTNTPSLHEQNESVFIGIAIKPTRIKLGKKRYQSNLVITKLCIKTNEKNPANII